VLKTPLLLPIVVLEVVVDVVLEAVFGFGLYLIFEFVLRL
jgi:hypothetical protein